MSMIEKFFSGLHNARISTKIMIIYTVCFFALLIVITTLTWCGVSYGLYYQAERSITFSMEQMRQMLEQIEQNMNIEVNSLRDPLTPGVVLRVVAPSGEVFIDTDPRFPSIERFNSGLVDNPPIWANENMKVSELGRSIIYRSQMQFTFSKEPMTLYFFRTITSDKSLFDRLLDILIAIDVIGLFIATGGGYVVSKRILKPISDMTETAHNIAFEKMDGRIQITPVDDELTKLAKTFNGMLDRLQVGIVQQQRFVSDASHELRTPMTVIKGHADLLARWGMHDPEVLKEGIETIQSEADNMQQLIEQLLFLARADQRRQPLKMEMLELSKIVADVVMRFELVTHDHVIRLDQNDKGTIFGDKITIIQMLRIFIDNAIKYTPAGGTITVSSIRAVDKIKLSIADTGIGIAPANQKKVFERFFRVDTSHSKQRVSGTGLGLSIATWIADQHDATIDLTSELGKGTTITVTMMLQPDQDEFIDQGDTPPDDFVAVVDQEDDHDLRQFASLIDR